MINIIRRLIFQVYLIQDLKARINITQTKILKKPQKENQIMEIKTNYQIQIPSKSSLISFKMTSTKTTNKTEILRV